MPNGSLNNTYSAFQKKCHPMLSLLEGTYTSYQKEDQSHALLDTFPHPPLKRRLRTGDLIAGPLEQR